MSAVGKATTVTLPSGSDGGPVTGGRICVIRIGWPAIRSSQAFAIGW